jgi:hypothetical protein
MMLCSVLAACETRHARGADHRYLEQRREAP